jgi:pSer/pThr/pTyr-binding forkhead associated (FHA) protein
LKDGRVEIEDLKSRNGTFINNKQLKGSYLAKSGDRLRVGRLNFEILIDQSKAGNKKPVVKNVAEAAARTAQKPKKENFEDSISDWLTEQDDEPLGSFGADTIQFSLDDIDVVSDKDKSIEDLKADSVKEDTEEPETVDETGAKKKKKEYGKLPPLPKFSHDDSTSAAGDVLKKFFNRR